MFGKIIIVASLAVLVSCSSQQKSAATPAQAEAFQKMVSGKSFEILANWARPLASGTFSRIANTRLIPVGSTANRIDIGGGYNYLRVEGDSVMADLPYFGERQLSGPYAGSESGVKFKGVAKDFELVPNKDGDGYNLRFDVSENGETFQVSAKLFPTRSTVNVISSHRTAVGYDGRLVALAEE